MPNTIKINISKQLLTLENDNCILQSCLISTATNGSGELKDSEKTPRGWHEIHAKIGEGCLPNIVFVARQPTGEIYSSEFAKQFPGRDWILTRILWLTGLEEGKNLSGAVDTLQRYIYIHGSPDSAQMGKPASRGCIRMRNQDMIDLFDKVAVGTKVLIEE